MFYSATLQMLNTCAHATCPRVPRFGSRGKKPEYCIEHKTYWMTDKQCKHLGCRELPRAWWFMWNPLYCEAHSI